MSNVKNLLFFLSIFLTIFYYENIQATNKIYKNKNNLVFTEKEYTFITEFYNYSYFENMTFDDYLWLKDLDVNNRNVNIYYITDKNIPTKLKYFKNNYSYQTKSKKLTVASSCNDTCTIVTNLNWILNPVIRSYDIIGARFINTFLAFNSISTKVSSTNGTQFFNNHKYQKNGIGSSIKLPSDSSNIFVQQKFTTIKQGTIYISYQHAITYINLQTSQKYNIGSNGYGNVFVFYGDAINKFDNMNGIKIDL